MEEKKSPPFYASVIAIDGFGRVLLGKRREDGIWTPPGGGADEGETAEEAACREMFEEAGVICNPRLLIALPPIRTRNDRVCHCFLYPCDYGVQTTSSMDPDKEVSTWEWFSLDNVPKDLKEDPRRFESVRNAYMKYHGIKKGGPGSGVKGHFTQHPDGEDKVVSLTDKLEHKTPFKAHLDMLEHGAVLEGEELRSGKPLYLQMDQATAHGYTPQDHNEAANIHYNKAQMINENIQKIKAAGKEVPKEVTGIFKFHQKAFKAHMAQAETLQRRMGQTKEAIKQIQKPYMDKHPEAKVKKSDEHTAERAAAAVEAHLNRLVERKPELLDNHPEWHSEEKSMKPHEMCKDTMKHVSKCDCAKCKSTQKNPDIKFEPAAPEYSQLSAKLENPVSKAEVESDDSKVVSLLHKLVD